MLISYKHEFQGIMDLDLPPGPITFFMILDKVLDLIRPQFLLCKMERTVPNSLHNYEV